ncbi:MAG: hypothetical protein AMJ79_07270 [Phycisphaerae bacterium SM23_30]|nr:MAG: hypothetical protein AMJ79_07270 [Phycisphaerae bacterium SM23_30]
MKASSETETPAPPADFAALTDRLQALPDQASPDQIETTIAHYARTCANRAHAFLLQGVLHYLKKQYAQTIQLMHQARDLLTEDEHPAPSSIYSEVFINSQWLLPRRQRPAAARAYGYYKKNIDALRRQDAALAHQVQAAEWPGDFVVLDFWGGLHLFNSSENILLVMDGALKKSLAPVIGRRDPLTFGGVGTGQELRYCLNHQVNLLHGMTRPHYLFEADPAQIKLLLHLDDFSRPFATEELIIFGGAELKKRLRQIFQTLRYISPNVIIGNANLVQPHLENIRQYCAGPVSAPKVQDYYNAEEFMRRRQGIAAGEIAPRILVCTCRWTTFLKYCAADFEKSFNRLGCDTLYFIEENDVQSLTAALHWQGIDQFKPDAVFLVSHARPTLPYLPEPLAFISFIQDKCGPLETHANLADKVQPHDLFVCATDQYRHWLIKKQVAPAQTCVFPVPADDDVFFPLDEPAHPRYVADVGFVKHGGPEFEKAFENFQKELQTPPHAHRENNAALNVIRAGFDDLYRQFCRGDLDQPHYDDEMTEFMLERVRPANDQARHLLDRLIWLFYCGVYSNAWRYHFLEELDKAGIPPALYGNNWDQHARLKHLGRGPVDHGPELNQVYNFNKISLSINHFVTMNQRVSECTLAGGFIMIASHRPGKDGIDARNYYRQNDQIILFHSAADLIDKCRYYLEHPDQRNRIAQNARRRARKEMTVNAAAQKMLQQWRRLLQQTQPPQP